MLNLGFDLYSLSPYRGYYCFVSEISRFRNLGGSWV